MSALWLDEIVEEIFHLRLRHGWRHRGAGGPDFLLRHAQFVRHVRHRQTAPALRQIKAPSSREAPISERQHRVRREKSWSWLLINSLWRHLTDATKPLKCVFIGLATTAPRPKIIEQ
jgi:hypothetical protein